MGRGLIIIIIAIILIVIGVFIFIGGDSETIDLGDSLGNVQKIESPGSEGVDEMIVNDDSGDEDELTGGPEEVVSVTKTVEMSSSGFSPSTLEINEGDSVMFKQIDSSNRWPASANHPTHTIYPGSSKQKCGSEEQDKIFDSCRGLKEGENWSFTFVEVGDWGYHDHLNAGKFGKIIVN